MPSRTPDRDPYVLLWWLAEAGGLFALLFVFLWGGRRDFLVPLDINGDALEYLMQVKGTIENGWWWVHPRLSAPGVFQQVQFPSNPTVDQAVVWIVHLFTREPGLVINTSWMIMVVLSGLIASRCLMLLGISPPVARAMGLLFAFSPYALIRHINHFSLAIYLIPFPCTVALLVATGRLMQSSRAQRWTLGFGCALVGFNYPYYAFFACFLILTGSLLVSIGDRNHRELRSGLLMVGVICLATAVNVMPSFYSWGQHGQPGSIPSKRPAEAEEYGLKIRQLVSPVRDHAFPLLSEWASLERGARYPLENENTSARLGLIATIGFVALLGGIFAPRISRVLSDDALFLSAGRLMLAALLLGTIGGFGSLFNLLIAADIRAYNRVEPFIAFLCFVAVALIAQTLLAASASTRRRERVAAGVFVLILLIGLVDQGQAALPLDIGHQAIRNEWRAVSTFVHALEERLPAGAMVFQLPAVTFLNESGRERMRQFDHIKLYLPSTRVHWSYPALSDDVVRWQQQVARLPTRVLATALTREGFSSILIDRNGYSDGGESILAELGVAEGSTAVLAADARYVAVDLRLVQRADVPAERLPRLGETATAATIGLPRCVGGTAQYLDWVGDTSMPFAEPHVHVPASGEFSVTGWAVDSASTSLAGDVDVVVGDTAFPAFYGIERPDVEASLGSKAYRFSGFTVRLARTDVGSDPQPLSIRILANDRSCYYQGNRAWIETRATPLTAVDSPRME